jgi:hypothetical protein
MRSWSNLDLYASRCRLDVPLAGTKDHLDREVSLLLFDNDLDAAMLCTFLFLGSISGLLFLLAWLEQPPSERWVPRWWLRRRETAARSRTDPTGGRLVVERRVAGATAPAARMRNWDR